jgi:tetratricopeptide (TPR) repeat protein
VLTGLVELGSDRPVAQKPPAELRKALAAHIPKLRKAADHPLPPSAPPQARIERAALLIQIDRLDEAAALLEPLAPDGDTATLLLATVYRDKGRWAESDALYCGVLDRLLPRAQGDPAAREMCFTAVEGLAFNAREDRRPADAKRVLLRGLESLPSEAAYFHFQLGRHHADGGRPGLAIEHLRTAAALDPAKYGERAATLIRTNRASTPACLA